jgi:hypothetical protein|tara:strand:- start:245 stop:529 length:285 start_codon:yes stop_codon:yes gene_type:complete
MKLTSKKVSDYMSYRTPDPLIHCPDCIAAACNDMAAEHSHNEFINVKPLDFMRLLFFNDPIPQLHTHSYGFHTGSGRYIIEQIQQKYYEYKEQK